MPTQEHPPRQSSTDAPSPLPAVGHGPRLGFELNEYRSSDWVSFAEVDISLARSPRTFCVNPQLILLPCLKPGPGYSAPWIYSPRSAGYACSEGAAYYKPLLLSWLRSQVLISHPTLCFSLVMQLPVNPNQYYLIGLQVYGVPGLDFLSPIGTSG